MSTEVWVDCSVSAVDQLQGMAAKRQYKEAAGQLEVTFLWTIDILVVVHYTAV